VQSANYLQDLIQELINLPNETEWAEFKANYQDPQMIGEYISALSNSAALCGKSKGYLIWGINDDTRKIEGTGFNYRKSKKGNEELESWLSRLLVPQIDIKFSEAEVDVVTVLVLEIPCATTQPVRFAGVEYIRIGTSKKKLKDYPDKERQLWRTFDSTPFELRIVVRNISEDEIVMLLDYPKYYDLLELPIPKNRNKVFDDFKKEKFIVANDAGNWDITTMGALLMGKDIKKFEGMLKKTVRVIWYKGNDRINAIREKEFSGGYAFSHEDIVQYILTIIPQEEIMEGPIRKTSYAFPETVIRELLANSMIHQALEQKGTSIMVELFADRMEFSNAGAPLVEIKRILDTTPVTRNENIAGFMHKCGICEERGSGYDKIIIATSSNNMPAPRVDNQSNQFTKATVLIKTPFDMLSKEDKVRTCYMQACLAYVKHSAITNTDMRALFGLSNSEMSKASRLINSTVKAGLIKPVDPEAAPKIMRYIPFWA
jgi:predicted HTH transcriptional regulator